MRDSKSQFEEAKQPAHLGVVPVNRATIVADPCVSKAVKIRKRAQAVVRLEKLAPEISHCHILLRSPAFYDT